CSDSDSNAGTTTLPHDRVETSPGMEPYTLRSSGDVRHLAQPIASSLRNNVRGKPTAAYFHSPVPQRRNTSGALLDSGSSSRVISTSSVIRKTSASSSSEHSHSTQSMTVCEATAGDERSMPR
uniref:Protein kinase domain-containing protein n=1 Tax=Parascaris univalens TaxID=6257 RepID=A0A915A6B1_PARUN